MTGSAFPEKDPRPDDAGLAEVLGPAKAAWDALVAHVAARCAGVAPEWKHYGKKHGWQLKLTHRRRALLYLVPREGSFLAGMALREPAVAALRGTDLPSERIEEIEGARLYGEGRPARVEVRGEADLSVVRTLLELKLTT